MPGVSGSPSGEDKGDRRNQPFIKLLRRFQNHRFWCLQRKFSKAEAWIDMLFMAYYEPRNIVWNGQAVRLEPGEFMSSNRILAKRWTWPVMTVWVFLRNCEKHGEIRLHSELGVVQQTVRGSVHPGTRVTITNFAEIHQSSSVPLYTPSYTKRYITREGTSRENTARARARETGSESSVVPERLPPCDRTPGDGVSELERQAVRRTLHDAGFGGE